MKNSTKLTLLIFIAFIAVTFTLTYGIYFVKVNNQAGIWVTFTVFAIAFSSYIYLLNKVNNGKNEEN